MKQHFKKIYDFLAVIYYELLLLILKYAPVKLYQPLFQVREGDENTTRSCADRWEAIEPKMPSGAGSTLDIGCNLGFFTFQAHNAGKMAFGVDADPFYLQTCRAIAVSKNCDNAFFQKAWIDKSYLEKMPSYQVVFNFSVFHHWVKAYGAEEAQEMMKILAGKCEVLFFETGQPDELGTKWAEKLAFMGEKPDEWISGFLKEIGFKKVEILGTYETGLTKTKRHLFYAGK